MGSRTSKCLTSEEQPVVRHVLVTGCDSGFGQGLALKLKEKGFSVIAACYTEAGASQFQGKEGILPVVADLTDEKGIDRVVDAVMASTSSSDGLYGLVNNAGVALPGNTEWLPPSAYKASMDLNFHAPVALTYRLLPLLKVAKGRLINLTSVDGFISLPTNPAYCASKHALEAYSDVLRAEMLPWGVKVIVVQPATMRTPLAMSYADGWLKSYEQASDDVKAQYGDLWAKEIHATTKQGIADLAADPEITVEAMMSALDPRNKNPPTRMATGKAASYLWKPLSRLPDKTRDSVLYTLSFSTKKPPIGLWKIDRPPVNNVSHVTIRVSNIQRAVEFYSKFELRPISPIVEGHVFLGGAPADQKNWPTLVLLQEDPKMSRRGPSYRAGMTRLCIYSKNVDAEVKRLQELGLEPMAPVTSGKVGQIAAYTDPDGFVVYYISFGCLLGCIFGCLSKKKADPYLFHWTVNVTNADVGKAAFEKLGFKTISDQTKDQVGYDLLPAFGTDPDSEIRHIRLCKLPADGFVATIMEWVRPKSEMLGEELLNSMTVAVQDVDAALSKATEAGMTIAGPIATKTLPIFGKVRAFTAYVEPGCNPIEFCCFEQGQ